MQVLTRTRTRTGLRRRSVGAAVLAVLAVAAVLVFVTRDQERDVAGTGRMTAVSADELAAAARARVYFGHQSVGENLLDALPAVYARQNVQAPVVVDVEGAAGRSGGFLAENMIGENTKPLSKIQDFEKALRGGLGDRLDIALMKFCYLDVDRTTDVDALFADYRRAMADLQRDYPRVRFLHVTVPLTTDPTVMQRLKGLLGRPTSQPDNAARERYNTLVRAEYGDRVFDLAAIQSTTPEGERVEGTVDGATYYALHGEYAADSGHFNERASVGAAGALLATIARAAR